MDFFLFENHVCRYYCLSQHMNNMRHHMTNMRNINTGWHCGLSSAKTSEFNIAFTFNGCQALKWSVSPIFCVTLKNQKTYLNRWNRQNNGSVLLTIFLLVRRN